MTDYSILPTLNALFNTISALLLLNGYLQIRARRIRAHTINMAAAFGVSSLFLISYLVYHANAGSMRFQGSGWIRPVYFAILLTHTLLAALIVPLILRTLYLAVRKRWESHRRWAKWTLPLWLYVSVTGVVIYEMLY